jgi:tRNA(Ile)-lysidine synthase
VAGLPARYSVALGHCLGSADPLPSGLCVALSGGLDSSLLLAMTAALRGAKRLPRLRALHVDHGLHPDSSRWSAHCVSLAARLEVPLEVVAVDARPRDGESPEAAAREARYAALRARLGDGEMLLTAHHADDQLEGVLLQWLRGGGLRAVAGMAPVRRFGPGWHARPLLGCTRDELAAEAATTGLDWVEDPSNVDVRLDRNYLRHSVLPALRSRWPAAARTVGRVAAQAAEALAMEDEIAAADLGFVAEGAALVHERLDLLPEARRRWVLRRWLRVLGLPVPSEATLASLEHDAARAADDRIPCTRWPGARVHRYRGRLYAEREALAAAVLPARAWAAGAALDLGVLGRLEFRAATGHGLAAGRIGAGLAVVARPEGARFRPENAAHHRPMRKWLQDRGVLPWRRAQLPLLAVGDEIVAVADLAIADGWAAGDGEPGWVVEWRDRPPLTTRDVAAVKVDATDGDDGD